MSKLECSNCGAEIDVPEDTENYEMIDCYNCEAMLEYIDGDLVDISD